MARIIEGKPHGKGKKVSIVASRFNDFITQRLLDACLNELTRRGVRAHDITVVWVPGSFEIPVAALKLAKKKGTDAVICLGAVIRGETFHFDLVAQGAAQGIMQISLFCGKPVIFGVLTTDTVEQAYKRSQEKGGNKGLDAATAALEMIDMMTQIK